MYFTHLTPQNSPMVTAGNATVGWSRGVGSGLGWLFCVPAWPEVPLDTCPTLEVTMEAFVNEANMVEWVSCVQADVSL